MDFDPTRMDDLCDEASSLGDLFNQNMENCADCVRDNNGLNSTHYDQGDAQDTLRVVNLCQANFPTNHSNIVSAMSVISKYGKVVGAIAPAQTTTSATTPLANVPATATATATSSSTPINTPPVNAGLQSGSKAWIAGAVIGPIAAVAIFAIGILIILKRRKAKNSRLKSSTSNIESTERGGYVFEKSELPAQGHERVELPTEHVVEADVRLPPQELESTVLAELQGDSSKNNSKHL